MTLLAILYYLTWFVWIPLLLWCSRPGEWSIGISYLLAFIALFIGSRKMDNVAFGQDIIGVGTHAGRKTFICFALSNGVPPDVVMKFTGHSDYKSMKPYIDITESAKRDAISIMERAFDAK